MPFIESVYVALFIITIVFVVLCSLYLCIRLFSYSLQKLEAQRAAKRTQP